MEYENIPLLLQEAIDIWTAGEPIQLDMAMTLMGMGYDVVSLESQYLTN